ncbi:MAG: virulence factor BrkB family protein [Pseudomonadaceae bacterium]|nr:MAG: virulence factor BrkB family protein [Pseudomonadaceae bacterium]
MPRQINLLLHFAKHMVRRFGEDNCAKNAAALTYTTLFAVVPVMTVTFAMMAAIPAFNEVSGQVEDFVFNNFVPSAGETVQGYLIEFSQQARQLTGVGIALLIVTAFLMLVNIEKAFNAIWRIRQPRRGVSSFLLYWAVLSLGPLLLGAGFVISTYVTSLAFFTGDDTLSEAWAWLLGWVPLLLSIAAFTLIFVAVPNTRVPLRHGFAGGVLVALLFEGAKALFALYVALFPGYQLIYGAFAAFPLFLLWIYISWVIVLFGAELVSNLGNLSAWEKIDQPDLLHMLNLLRVLLLAHKRGYTVDLARVNAMGWPMHEEIWLRMIDELERQSIITRAQQGGYVLSQDLDQLEMAQLLENLPEAIPPLSRLPERMPYADDWYTEFHAALEELAAQRHSIMAGSVKQWLLRDEKNKNSQGELL